MEGEEEEEEEEEVIIDDTTDFLFKPRYAQRFGRVVADEGHMVKNQRSLAHYSVKSLLAPSFWIVTATPLLNKTTDLLGYLELLWKARYQTQETWTYDEATEQYGAADLRSDDHRHILDPWTFGALIHHGQIDIRDASTVLSKILHHIQLRRTMGTVVDGPDGDVAIGLEIPAQKIQTVELEMSPAEQALHDRFYSGLVTKLKGGGSSDPGQARREAEAWSRALQGETGGRSITSISPSARCWKCA